MSYLIYFCAQSPNFSLTTIRPCKQGDINIEKIRLLFLVYLTGKAYILTCHNHSKSLTLRNGTLGNKSANKETRNPAVLAVKGLKQEALIEGPAFIFSYD